MTSSPKAKAQAERITNNGNPSHYGFLDGMRGLAALYVVVHHIWGGTLRQTGAIGFFFNWLGYGHLAVDLFIVLSGFCLALPTIKMDRLDGSYLNFLRRRALRILPPYYACLVIYCLWAVFFKYHSTHVFELPFEPRVLAVNFLLLEDFFPKALVINVVLWSVALEFKIYLLFPFFVSLRHKYGNVALLVVAGAIGYGATAIYGLCFHSIDQLFTCLWYVLLFAMGICSAHIASKSDLSYLTLSRPRLHQVFWCSLVSLIALLYVFPLPTPELQAVDSSYVRMLPIIDPVAGLLACCGLIILFLDGSRQTRYTWKSLLGARIPVLLGKFSYSLYLLHILTFGIAGMIVQQHFHALWKIYAFPVNVVILLPVALGASYFFFLLVEKRFLRKRKVPPLAPVMGQ